ncbi:MAG: elongation factor G [Nitrospina sp.]|nr:elongation factor G [Nitrospina sp.]
MKSYSAEHIRNVGLIGHGGSGKTSVAEAILYLTGVSDRLGKPGDNSSVMDFDPDEVKRGNSINASLASFEHQKHKINLLDTPGSNNFVGDTVGCIRVVDGAVVVIGADAGVQFYTEKTWKWADDENIPRIIFINKMDAEQAQVKNILDTVKKKFGVNPILFDLPVGSGEAFKGIVDLVEQKYFAYEKGGDGKGTVGEVPADIADDVETTRMELVEAVAEADDELIETYLEKGELSEDEFLDGLRHGIAEGRLVPVLCGSAIHNIGVDRLLDALIDYIPSPDKREPVLATHVADGSEKEIANDSGAPFTGQVFKTIADPYAGKLTLFRVMSGKLTGDSSVYNVNHETNERIGHLLTLQGKKQVQLTEAVAGDIVCVAKLKVTGTGDSLGPDAKTSVRFPAIPFPNAVLARGMVPKTRADEEKISNALHRLCEEDPTLKVERDAQTHELVVSGMGAVHLDVVLERMKRRFSVEVDVKPPKVPYLETIRASTKVQGKYKKQTGGRGQYGDCWLEIAPMPKGGGFEFENKVVGGAIPKTYIPAVEKGVQEAMAGGVVAHYPMVDIRVAVYDGSYHDVDSSEMAFKIAGSMGFKKGVQSCKPTLLEPVMLLNVMVPSEAMGDVIGDLNSKRGKVIGVEADGDSQNIRAHVPMASILNYAPELRAITGGRGEFEMEFDHYDDVPEHIAAKIIEEAQLQHEEEKE